MRERASVIKLNSWKTIRIVREREWGRGGTKVSRDMKAETMLPTQGKEVAREGRAVEEGEEK